MNCELIVDARNGTGESPVWHPSEQALYWVDIPARQLHRWQAADGKHQCWQGDEMLACIARSGQGWVAGMESGIFQLQARADGSLDSRLLSNVQHAQAGQCSDHAGARIIDCQQVAAVQRDGFAVADDLVDLYTRKGRQYCQLRVRRVRNTRLQTFARFSPCQHAGTGNAL